MGLNLPAGSLKNWHKGFLLLCVTQIFIGLEGGCSQQHLKAAPALSTMIERMTMKIKKIDIHGYP